MDEKLKVKKFINLDPHGKVWAERFINRLIDLFENCEEGENPLIGVKAMCMLMTPLRFLMQSFDEEQKRDVVRLLIADHEDLDKIMRSIEQ